MRVLVTGGAGFLGSHVCEMFRGDGDEVIAYDNLTKYELDRVGYSSEKAREHNLHFLKTYGVKVVVGDVADRRLLQETAKGCDYIVHTAAQPAMTISIENPALDFASNSLGTFNCLETARALDIPIAICSTIHVYGNKINETLWEEETRFVRRSVYAITAPMPAIDEFHPLMEGTTTPLHASKRTGEIYAQAYMDTYGLKAAVLRLTGIYGPRQFGGEDHGWVANFAIRVLMGRPITIFGTDKQVRDILYVKDAAQSFKAFYDCQQPGIYNIGAGIEQAISLGECIKKIEEIAGRKTAIKAEPMRKGDLWYFVCDVTKAKRELGWEPKTSTEQGLAKLLNWIKQNEEIFQ